MELQGVLNKEDTVKIKLIFIKYIIEEQFHSKTELKYVIP